MFNCTKCGACCKLAGVVVTSHNIPFPYNFNEDGTCEKYDESIGCTVYEDRPDICRIDKMKLTSGLSEQEYEIRTASACNVMMDILGIDESFKIYN